MSWLSQNLPEDVVLTHAQLQFEKQSSHAMQLNDVTCGRPKCRRAATFVMRGDLADIKPVPMPQSRKCAATLGQGYHVRHCELPAHTEIL